MAISAEHSSEIQLNTRLKFRPPNGIFNHL